MQSYTLADVIADSASYKCLSNYFAR